MILDIAKIRREKGMTQKCVAEKIGISRSAYTNIERGERRPSVETAKKIAHVLDFDWTLMYQDD